MIEKDGNASFHKRKCHDINYKNTEYLKLKTSSLEISKKLKV